MSDSAPLSIVGARFVAEARDPTRLPPAGPPEVAIAGRSNVGKSTLLNRMAGRHALARVSKTPGRTRGLVLFDLDLRWTEGAGPQRLRVVDLPGYGYAQVSRSERQSWQALVEGYIQQRDVLKLVLVLVDARRALAALAASEADSPGPARTSPGHPVGVSTEDDLQLLEWLQGMHVPCHLVITKADKLRAAERGVLRERARKDRATAGVTVSLVSGVTGEGVGELWVRIARALTVAKHDEATPSR